MAKKKDSDNQYSTGSVSVGNGNNQTPENKTRIDPHSFPVDMLMALRFYSRFPTGSRPHETPDFNQIAPVLAFASVAISLIPVLVFSLGMAFGLPALLSASFGIGAQIIVTGAMAEDALADSADGLWGGAEVSRRLAIMKDPRHGTYGVLAIVLLVAIRLSALSTLLVWSGIGAIMLWLAAQIIARQGALWLLLVLPPARTDGTARAAGTLLRTPFVVGASLGALLFLVAAGAFVGIFGLALTLSVLALIVWGWSRICRSLVGGYTGDLIGALQALLEIAALSSFILFI